MKIDHLAIWVEDIELLRQFYMTYFDMSCGEKYVNAAKKYTSYFLDFPDQSTRIELMNVPEYAQTSIHEGKVKGLAHFAISVGSKNAVDLLTERLRKDGYNIVGEPRTTGDGCYESVILDPEGNYVEITE